MAKSLNIKQVIDLEVTFISENNHKKKTFFSKVWLSFQRLVRPILTPIKMGMFIKGS